MKKVFAIFAVAVIAATTLASGPPLKALERASIAPITLPAFDLPHIEFKRQAAQSEEAPTKIEGIWNFKDISAVVSHRVTGLTDLFGIKGFSAEARGFGGINISEHNSPTVGGALCFSVRVSKEMTGSLGFGYQVIQKNEGRFILYGGLNIPIGK